MKNKVILDDIVVFRILIIFFLITYHSMAMFNGNWAFPPGYTGGDYSVYKWIARFSYSVMLESFVFISGFLFALQIPHYIFKDLLKRKFFRLMVPCLVWGMVYELLFRKAGENVFSIVNGVGHLWFLPMLFWCFIAGYFIFKYISNPFLVLSITLLLIVFSFFCFVPFGMGYACKYLFYFALGYYCFLFKKNIIKRGGKWKYIFLVGCVYCFTFILYYWVKGCEWIGSSLATSLISFILSVIYKCSGILGIYLLINLRIRHGMHLSSGVYILSGCTFGIYIFHQMVLEYLYYHTGVPEYTGLVFLPFIGMILAFGISILLTFILQRTSVGKILL